MPNIARCEFCGKELQPRLVHLLGQDRVIGHEPCGCADAVAKRAAQQTAQEAEAQRKERERRNRSYECAGIPPRYRDGAMEPHRALYIVGPVGTGKTYHACAMAKQAIDERVRVRFTSSVDLLAEIRSTYSGRSWQTEDDIVDKYGTCGLLVLDDLGKEQPTEWSLSCVWRIINRRYGGLLETIVTTQYERDDLVEHLGGTSQETAVSIVSRLYEMCERYPMAGEDRRLHA